MFTNKRNLSYNDMLKKLNELYDKEVELITQIQQLQEDKELLQTMIMHQFNREGRENDK